MKQQPALAARGMLEPAELAALQRRARHCTTHSEACDCIRLRQWEDATLLRLENERLLDENARLLEFEKKLAARLIERDLGPGTQAEIEQEGNSVRVRVSAAEFAAEFGQLMADAMEDAGGTNSVEWQCVHNELGPLTLTLQRVEGKTPGEQREEAEAEVTRLKALLRDALAGLETLTRAYPSPGTPAGAELVGTVVEVAERLREGMEPTRQQSL